MKYVLPFAPKPCPRPRVTRQGHAYYPADYDAWLDKTVKAINEQLTRVQETACAVTIVLRPKSFEVEIVDGFDRPEGIRADVDNLAKGILDACVEGGAISPSDALVTSLTVIMEADTP